jgi:predicted nucleotidyltransferase
MRIPSDKAEIIRSLVRKHFGDNASVYLFGSRVDDSRRGGDIDLYISVPGVLQNKARAVLKFNADLQIALGEQRIDVIVRDAATKHLAIHEEAARTGVRL